MAKESLFVTQAQLIVEQVLRELFQSFQVVRGAPLLYEIVVDHNLKVMKPEQIRQPKRGTSAFQTDLCVFEKRAEKLLIPRVVIEFKTKITTHDVLTYSAKAVKHKQIYPYLRYGILASDENSVPGRVFKHNGGLDFFAAAAAARLEDIALKEFLASLLTDEIAASRCLEKIAFGAVNTRLFRTEIKVT